MSLTDFMAVQAQNAAMFSTHPVFASLVPLVDRMYETAGILASKRHSHTLVRLMMVCRREFLVAESQVIRGLPFDAHANTRRAVEAAKVALAVKRNRANAEEWLKTDVRQRRWDARQQGQKPEHLPSARFPELDQEPLLAPLQQYFGMASDLYVHFTPEFFGRQTFTQTRIDDENVFVKLDYITDQREILFTGIHLCSIHVHTLMVFNATFDNVMADDAGWKLLKTTFDQLAADLLREVPPPHPEAPTAAR
jgi:hypothetical protein